MERLEIEILARVEGLNQSLNQAQSRLEKFGKAAEDFGFKYERQLEKIMGSFFVHYKVFKQ